MIRTYDKMIFEGTLHLLSSLHIGTGRMSLETDATVVKDINQQPYIPGSSLKGVIRTIVERFHHLVLDVEHVKTPVCFLAEQNCSELSTVKKQIQEKGNNEAAITEVIENDICPVCQLFGSTFRASKLIVHDARLMNSHQYSRKLTTIRHGIAINRDTGTAKEGAKYDYEVVHEGLEFQFKLEAENVNEQDQKLLLIALQFLMSGNIHIGGKTSRGLGLVKLRNLKMFAYEFSNQDDRHLYLQSIISGKHEKTMDFTKWQNEVFMR